MKDIAFALGSFTGGLIFSLISWKLGAWLAGTMTRSRAVAAILVAAFSYWYASTRDASPAILGAWLALVLMAVTSGATKPTDRE